MALTTDLISQFAKITKDTSAEKKDTIVYGTVVESEGGFYVNIDGSDILTPIVYTTNVSNGERVTILIKNHTAMVTGNITSPSTRNSDVNATVKASIDVYDEEIKLAVEKVDGFNDKLNDKLDAEEPSVGVVAGSSVTIREDKVDITTPNFNVNILGEDGVDEALNITPEGSSFAKAYAPNLTPRYDGPDTLYVDPDATSEQIEEGNYFRSLSDVFSMLSYKIIHKTVTINVAKGMTEYSYATLSCAIVHDLYITGMSDEEHSTIVGQIRLSDCCGFITFSHIDVQSGTDNDRFYIRGCGTICKIDSCVITGNSSANAIYVTNGAKAYVTNCEMYNCGYAIRARYMSIVYALNNKGDCQYLSDASIIFGMGTIPGTAETATGRYENYGILRSTNTVDQGNASDVTVETSPGESSYIMAHSDTYAGSWTRYSDNDIRQGYNANGNTLHGCIWFDNATIRSNLSGKVVKQASISLHRHKGVGRSSNVSIQLYGTVMNYDGRVGAPMIVDKTGKPANYGTIGSIAPGEMNTFTIPTKAVEDLVAGNINGLVLISKDTSLYKDRNYSQNWARFSGETSGTAETKPILTVMCE